MMKHGAKIDEVSKEILLLLQSLEEQGISDEQAKILKTVLSYNEMTLSNQQQFAAKFPKLKELGAFDEFQKSVEILGAANQGSLIPLARAEITKWSQVVYSPVTMLQLSLPSHKPEDSCTAWETKNGESDILIYSGKKQDDKKHYIDVGLPHGSLPRLVLFYINNWVKVTKRQDVFLGYSAAQFFAKLGLSRQDNSYERLRDLEKLLRCGFTVTRRYAAMEIDSSSGNLPFSGEGTRTEYKQFSSIVEEWQDKNQSALRISLSDTIFQSILENPLPASMDVIKKIKNSALKLDIYAFLAERLHRVEEGETEAVKRSDIEALFGNNSADKSKFFREKFKPALASVLKVYPEAKVDVEKSQIILHHTAPQKALPDNLVTF